MRVLKILKSAEDFGFSAKQIVISSHKLNKAIEELEDLQNENKSLVKTLEKYNEEMIKLRIENQELREEFNL